jgi:NADPH:quinone reductase-like Zn-dependent oxidoreductase
MKAAVYRQYGSPDVIELTEVPTPTPKAHDVLIQVQATTVTAADWRARSLQLPKGFGFMGRLVFGIAKPRQPILGAELAGVIVAVGKDVSRFKVGEQVFAFTDFAMGCHAEYVCMPETGSLAPIPANLPLDEAAALSFGGTTALVFLKKAKIQKGDRVLINGASGAVGTAAVQLAKHFGADVTGVCSTGNIELVKGLGADRVIDYTRREVLQAGDTYDIILDAAGTLPFSRTVP